MKKCFFPIPGVEPGPPGWKPGILTARPYGNWTRQLDVFDKSAWFVGFVPWLVKRATSGFSTCFSSSVAKQVVRFCCPFYLSLTNVETMKKKKPKTNRGLSRGLIKTVFSFITLVLNENSYPAISKWKFRQTLQQSLKKFRCYLSTKRLKY